jgi:SAM-dependent methyltransferase/uncharacterized protein YbaR (Trm112 family)
MTTRDLLRSPTDKSLLRDEDGALVGDDGQRYPVVGGVPILLASDLSLFSAEEVAGRQFVERDVSPVRRLVRRILPDSTLSIGTAQRYAAFAQAISSRARPDVGRVLVIGGGQLGKNMAPLVESGLDVIESDVYLSPRVQVVCDGHNLPFADGSFDGVVLQAVLEHVLDPVRVVAEAHRVLKPTGLIYAETPFLQAVHEGPFDFTRWTELGHRRLFRMFREIDRGVVSGPASSLVWSIGYFARSIPAKRGRLQQVLEKLAVLAFGWIKYFDHILIGHPGAVDAAAGVYFVGEKSSDPLDDMALLSSYAGSIGRPIRRNGASPE